MNLVLLKKLLVYGRKDLKNFKINSTISNTIPSFLFNALYEAQKKLEVDLKKELNIIRFYYNYRGITEKTKEGYIEQDYSKLYFSLILYSMLEEKYFELEKQEKEKYCNTIEELREDIINDIRAFAQEKKEWLLENYNKKESDDLISILNILLPQEKKGEDQDYE